jgi:hypothetical protein
LVSAWLEKTPGNEKRRQGVALCLTVAGGRDSRVPVRDCAVVLRGTRFSPKPDENHNTDNRKADQDPFGFGEANESRRF